MTCTARAFFARMLFTRRELSPAGRALVREQYLKAVERELNAPPRTTTLIGPPDAFTTGLFKRTGRR